MRVYPLGASDRDRYQFYDITDQPGDITSLAWEDNLEFWRVLHDVISAEPAVEEMRPMLGTLAELGIEAGRPFQPSADRERLLTRAAGLGRDEMLVAAFSSRRPDRVVWPDRTWEWVGLRPENGSFERDGSLDVEARDRWFARPDGADHVDLYFGPTEPAGAAGRWIQTVPGRGWFCYFRIYGPETGAVDGSWRPGDFTTVS